MNIRAMAMDMVRAVEAFAEKARRFFYSAKLLGYRCPQCAGLLVMIKEGMCQCICCKGQFDPTVAFQRCSNCGGRPVISVRRYRCSRCGSDIASAFLFDGLVFDADYFREKMQQSRRRKQQQRERVRQMLADSRSAELSLRQADLQSSPGLVDALNALTEGVSECLCYEPQCAFNLERYERHIEAHMRDFAIRLADIPPLHENHRKDLIWRFVAVIFLAHAGIAEIEQHGRDIMVMRHETHREGQDIPGGTQESDGVQGSLGRAEIC